ncbi:hypothetical protein KQJ25_37285, partial [Escherichia sp. S69_ASV_4]|nr:hypothetical protein [Escherichia sp. S69_ASV_4]
MKALTYHGPHHVQVENVPDPGIEQADDIIPVSYTHLTLPTRV